MHARRFGYVISAEMLVLALQVVSIKEAMSDAPQHSGPTGNPRGDPGDGPGLTAPLSRETQERFVTDNMRRIFRQIYRLVGNIHDAQDLTQETFIKALQRQEQLKDEQKAAHWLSRIATNTALDFLRRHNRVSFCEMTEAPEMHMETPEATALRSEQREWLNEGLERLTPRERSALVLRDVEDLPAEEVARRLDCSKATVRSHIANARIKLRKFAGRRTR